MNTLNPTALDQSIADLAEIIGPVVYDRDSWHRDCAEYMVSSDPAENDKLRRLLSTMLWWLQREPCADLAHTLFRANCISDIGAKIGQHIIETSIKNGLTLENLGENTHG